MTPAERKAAQQAEAQRQLEADATYRDRVAEAAALDPDPIAYEAALTATTAGLDILGRNYGVWRQQGVVIDAVAVRIGPGPDRPVAHRN